MTPVVHRADVRQSVGATPSASGGADPSPSLSDALAGIYALLVSCRDADIAAARVGAKENAALRAKALRDLKAALDRAAANDADAGSGLFAILGKAVDDVVGDLVHLRFADAVDDFGSDAKAAWNSPKFWSDLQNGLQDIALVSNGVAEAAQQVGGEVGASIAAAAGSVGSWATAGASMCHARLEAFQAAGQDARADATGSQADIDGLTQRMKWITDDLRVDVNTNALALRSVESSLQVEQDTAFVPLAPPMKG